MRRHYMWFLSVAAVVLLMVGSSRVVQARTMPHAAQMESGGQNSQVIKEVRKKISGISDYGVFDWITFRVNGNQLVLEGYASRPILKQEAGRVVKGIKGISSVQNNIEVLPLSPVDNRLRAAVYNKIYLNPVLSRYNGHLGGSRRLGMTHTIGPDRIVDQPPVGYHAIHIIVNNGKVALYGIVDSKGDAEIANAQVKSVPGVFGVQNNLMVSSSKSF